MRIVPRLVLFIVGIALPVALLAAPPPKAPARSAAARDWSRTVIATPEGGFRMGNPNAPVKLVEFGSLTCHVCEDFAKEGYPSLVRNYVKRGIVSFEFRNFVRDSYDLAAAVMTNCAAPQSFFPLTEQLFVTRTAWLQRFDAIPQEQTRELEQLALAARLQRLADIGGLTAAAARFGVTPARAKACLSDPKSVERLMEIRRVALTQYELQGTPTFLVNGRKVEASSWAVLEPRLKLPAR